MECINGQNDGDITIRLFLICYTSLPILNGYGILLVFAIFMCLNFLNWNLYQKVFLRIQAVLSSFSFEILPGVLSGIASEILSVSKILSGILCESSYWDFF